MASAGLRFKWNFDMVQSYSLLSSFFHRFLFSLSLSTLSDSAFLFPLPHLLTTSSPPPPPPCLPLTPYSSPPPNTFPFTTVAKKMKEGIKLRCDAAFNQTSTTGSDFDYGSVSTLGADSAIHTDREQTTRTKIRSRTEAQSSPGGLVPFHLLPCHQWLQLPQLNELLIHVHIPLQSAEVYALYVGVTHYIIIQMHYSVNYILKSATVTCYSQHARDWECY